MNRFTFRPAWCLLPLLTVSVGQAAYNPALVSAEARWVVFADLEGLRASTIGKELVAIAEKAQVQTTGGQIGVNLPKLFATIGTLTWGRISFRAAVSFFSGTATRTRSAPAAASLWISATHLSISNV